MKAAIGNLGALGFAIQTAFEALGIDVLIPPSSNIAMQEKGEALLRSDICHPLKILLGNYLFFKDEKPEIVFFYEGCDLCNLPPANSIFLDTFAKYNWIPECYGFDISNKVKFIKDFYNNLRQLSGKPRHKVLSSMILGYKKLKMFEYLDKVFYLIRPVIKDQSTGEKIYSDILEKLKVAHTYIELKNVKKQILELIDEYPPDHSKVHIGLIGDRFSLEEPFCHQFTDRTLGYLGAIVDRWIDNELLKKKYIKEFNKKLYLKNFYGVLTPDEIIKIEKYIKKDYDGLVFIAPFSCNPNDALRNQLSIICKENQIPLLSLIFDSQTSNTGLSNRLEAFVDLLSRKRQ